MTRQEQIGTAATLGLESTARATVVGIIAWCKACVERRRQRHFLATLDENMLRDIGLSRGQAWFESEKPFWRP